MSRVRASRRERIAVTAVAAYEIAALWTNLPTITWIVRRHPWIEDVIHEVLGLHFQPDNRGDT